MLPRAQRESNVEISLNATRIDLPSISSASK
jgi:hypothetical protein